MPDTRTRFEPLLSPVHAVVLAFPAALYPAALVSDLAYLNTAEIQWTNFSSWLIAGATLFAGLLVAWGLLSLFFGRLRHVRGKGILYTVLAAAMFVAGLVNAFQHAKDGWHSVGTLGLVLSVVCSVLAVALAILSHMRTAVREVRA